MRLFALERHIILNTNNCIVHTTYIAEIKKKSDEKASLSVGETDKHTCDWLTRKWWHSLYVGHVSCVGNVFGFCAASRGGNPHTYYTRDVRNIKGVAGFRYSAVDLDL